MLSVLRTKVFEGRVMPQVQRWIADNPLRRHDQTLDLHRWWQIITGHRLASDIATTPDYCIVEEGDGRRVLKDSGFTVIFYCPNMMTRGTTDDWRLTTDDMTSWHSRTIDVPPDDVKCDATGPSPSPPPPELLAEWGVEELKAQAAVSSSSFKLLLARPKTKPVLVSKPPAVAPPEHLLKQRTIFAKAFGESSSADIENWELHTHMKTYLSLLGHKRTFFVHTYVHKPSGAHVSLLGLTNIHTKAFLGPCIHGPIYISILRPIYGHIHTYIYRRN